MKADEQIKLYRVKCKETFDSNPNHHIEELNCVFDESSNLIYTHEFFTAKFKIKKNKKTVAFHSYISQSNKAAVRRMNDFKEPREKYFKNVFKNEIDAKVFCMVYNVNKLKSTLKNHKKTIRSERLCIKIVTEEIKKIKNALSLMKVTKEKLIKEK